MTLNNRNNIINKISNMTNELLERVDVEVFLVSKANSTDGLYNSKKEYLDNDLQKRIKKNIKKELNLQKFKDENEENKFYVTNYDNELTKKDFIAKLNLDEDEALKEKKVNLLEALNSNKNIEDSEVKFQVIKLTVEDESVHLIYYRGIRISAMNRKNISRIPTIRHREKLVIQENDVVEFGGKIELIILNDVFYIISPRTLEYSFDYTDHISRRKNDNLIAITSMDFFKDKKANVEIFINKSDQYMISRRLAGIKEETLDRLEDSFNERCQELKKIKEETPENEYEKEEYIKKYEPLWPLFHHIDVFDKKIRVNSEKSIEPLIYFFSDKIVESFLTKELREEF